MGTSVTLALSLLEERHQAMGRNRNPMWWDWSTAFQHFHHNHYWGMGVRTISGSQLGWKAKHPNTWHPTCMPAVKGSAYQLEMRSIFCRGRFGLLVSSPAALYLSSWTSLFRLQRARQSLIFYLQWTHLVQSFVLVALTPMFLHARCYANKQKWLDMERRGTMTTCTILRTASKTCRTENKRFYLKEYIETSRVSLKVLTFFLHLLLTIHSYILERWRGIAAPEGPFSIFFIWIIDNERLPRVL